MATTREVGHRLSVGSLNFLAGKTKTAYAAFAMIAFHDYWQCNISDEARFLAFCGSMRRISRSQILQDLWVLFELDIMTGGYFVEFGAYDGTVHSNTKLLEERFAWTGLLAEPNPDMAATLHASRLAVIDSRCVWDVTGDTVDLLVSEDAELATVAGSATPDLHSETRSRTMQRSVCIPCVSLNDLLDEHHAPAVIEFMSIDTEGTELKILSAFDFSARKIRLICVEHNHNADEAELDRLMALNGYERRFTKLSDWDAWYRLSTDPPPIA